MLTTLTMQDALLALTRFWTERGAMIVQPFNTEVGAGTMNPATILRVLGPEPWRVAYVEPSVRPDDARYGENPNRMQTHTQFQVILKPDPGNPQEIYLDSLRAIGIDVDGHDIRFVEDNWASPALGAWGLGWEVWLDGLEITQFTYFQQAGGQSLDPVSVEITYGIERILMALQNVDHFSKIAYAPGVSLGEFIGQVEYEMSRYYLDDASVETNRRLYADYVSEAQRCIDERLPVPAHTFVLKCSHTFNVLDSRGAVSTTERAKAFTEMRTLARQVSALWAERRKELGYPLGQAEPVAPAQLPSSEAMPVADRPATLVFEIGTEELPADVVTSTAEEVRAALVERLGNTRLTTGEVRTYGTPRRIVAVVEDVSPFEPDAERTARGPKVSAAFDADGKPTKAAEGFARGQGVDVVDLTRVQHNGAEHVAAVRVDRGRNAVVVLSELLGAVVEQLRAGKNMRWNDPKLSFSRPIRWLLALLGDVELPVAVSALRSGRTTRVLRNANEPVVEVPAADGYLDFLRAHDVEPDPARRLATITAAASELAATVGGVVDADAEAALLDEIANLVEKPAPLLGSYDSGYLDLPPEVLTTVMKKHQRYLPIRNEAGELLPYFVAVANGDCVPDLVRAGNESVLRARYEDAAFFWKADLATSPETMKQGLTRLAFETRLGSMADRAARIADVAGALSEVLPADRQATVRRAGQLAKFDLASSMVIELTSLAGTMAREYAIRAGEPTEVAAALYEMELPRTAGGPLPDTEAGAVLALADRFDLLTGLFAVGAQPTGSSDPFALRRAALGVVSILRAHQDLAAISVEAGLEAAAERIRTQNVVVSAEAVAEAREFVARRYEQQLLDGGHDYDQVQAVMPLAGTPARADRTLAELRARYDDSSFRNLVMAVQRTRRIVPDGTAATLDTATLTEPEELALADVVRQVGEALPTGPGLAEFVSVAGRLVDPINAFFDRVLVMAEDPALRAARLGLLATVRDLANGVLDWDVLP